MPEPQDVSRAKSLQQVLETPSTKPAAGVNAQQFIVLDGCISIENVAHMELLQEVGSFCRHVEEAKLRDVSGDIGVLRKEMNSFLGCFG